MVSRRKRPQSAQQRPEIRFDRDPAQTQSINRRAAAQVEAELRLLRGRLVILKRRRVGDARGRHRRLTRRGPAFGKGFGGIDAVVSLSVLTPGGLTACSLWVRGRRISFAASTAAVAAACFLIAPDISSMLLSSRAMRPDSRSRSVISARTCAAKSCVSDSS